jgi:hypothetical protein
LATALGGRLVKGAEPEPEPEKSEPGIGDKVRDDDYQFTVIKVRCGVSRVGGAYLNEKAQGQFCLVSLRVKNVGDDPTHYSEENQTLIDTKGKEHSPDDEAIRVLASRYLLVADLSESTLSSKSARAWVYSSACGPS